MSKPRLVKVKIFVKCAKRCGWGGYRTAWMKSVFDTKTPIPQKHPCPKCGATVEQWGGAVNYA